MVMKGPGIKARVGNNQTLKLVYRPSHQRYFKHNKVTLANWKLDPKLYVEVKAIR